jgi:hypothetical protein
MQRTALPRMDSVMRKGELWFNLFASFGPLAIGVVAAIMLPSIKQNQNNYIFISLSFYVAGLILFLIAKWSIMKTGKLITFGTSGMTQKNRWFYQIGYMLMGLGFIFYLLISVAV